MNNKQCLAKLDRMGVPLPKPGEPYTFFKLLKKNYEAPYWGTHIWVRGDVLVEECYDNYAGKSCGRGLNLFLDEPLPRSVYENDDLTPVELKRVLSQHSQLLKVSVMPEDVVCVPADSEWHRTGKIRVKKLTVGERVTYRDWLAILVEEGQKRSARRQRLLDANVVRREKS